jgi:hypothetical protein
MRCEGVGGKAEVRFFYSLNEAVEKPVWSTAC